MSRKTEEILVVLNSDSEKSHFESIFDPHHIPRTYAIASCDTLLQLLDKEFPLIILSIENDYKLVYCIFMVLKKLRPDVKVIGIFGDVSIETLTAFKGSGLELSTSLPVESGELMQLISAVQSKWHRVNTAPLNH